MVISVWCAIVSLGELAQVFFPLPQGTQFYLVIFLAAILPITLLCYRGWKVPALLNPFRGRSHDDPGITDWILAAVAFVVLAGWAERLVSVPAALRLLYLAPVTITAGFRLLLVAVVINLVRRQR